MGDIRIDTFLLGAFVGATIIAAFVTAVRVAFSRGFTVALDLLEVADVKNLRKHTSTISAVPWLVQRTEDAPHKKEATR